MRATTRPKLTLVLLAALTDWLIYRHKGNHWQPGLDASASTRPPP